MPHTLDVPRPSVAVMIAGLIFVALICWWHRVVRPCGALAECSTFGRVPLLAEHGDPCTGMGDPYCARLQAEATMLRAGRTVYPDATESPMFPRVGTNGVRR